MAGIGGGRRLVVVTGTNPAANVEISETVPAGELWELVAVHFTLVKSTTVGRVSLLLDDGTNVFAKIASQVDAPVATTTFSFLAGLPYASSAVADTHIAIGIPSGLYLPAGYRIRTTRSGPNAADDYSAPVIYVVKYVY